MTVIFYLQSVHTWLGTLTVPVDDETVCDVETIVAMALEEAEFDPARADMRAQHEEAEAWNIIGVDSESGSSQSPERTVLGCCFRSMPTEEHPINLDSPEADRAIDALNDAFRFDDDAGEGAAAVYCEFVGPSPFSFEDARDSYRGQWSKMEDYAREYADSCMEIPESVERYFNYEALGSDLANDMYYDEETGYLFEQP